jgi:signal transduction histidine kinase
VQFYETDAFLVDVLTQFVGAGLAKAGLGLGLYVCQQLIHHQMGEVGVESEPGKGATFWFTIPLHESSPDQ